MVHKISVKLSSHKVQPMRSKHTYIAFAYPGLVLLASNICIVDDSKIISKQNVLLLKLCKSIRSQVNVLLNSKK